MPEQPIVVTVDDAKKPELLVRLLRTIVDKLTSLGDRLEVLARKVKIPSMLQIREALQSTGESPLNVTGLRGVLIDPQPASALRYDAAPTGLVLQSLKDTQLVLVQNGSAYDLYHVLGGNPNTLSKLIGGAGGGNMMTTDTDQTMVSTVNKTWEGTQYFQAAVALSVGEGSSTFGAGIQIRHYSEELSLAGVTTKDSNVNAISDNSFILGTAYRITETISGGGVTQWSAGDNATAARFKSAETTLTAGNTFVGLNHLQGSIATDATGPVNIGSSRALRITLNNAPTQGKIRIYTSTMTVIAPTS